MRRFDAWRGFVVAGLMLLGCGDDDKDAGDLGGGNGAPVPIDELCDVVVDRLCASLTECWGWDYEDMDHCRADQECWGIDVLEAAIEAGEVRYEPEVVGQCRALYEVEPCLYTFFLGIPSVDGMLESCPYVSYEMFGTVPAGEPCMTDLSCDRNSYCVFDAQCPGTCQAFAGEGEPCGGDTEFRCNFRDDLGCEDGICQPVPRGGWPCETDADCHGGRCNRELTAFGICDPGGLEGEPCNEAQGQYCAIHLGCNTMDGTMSDGVCQKPAGDGEWCSDSLVCQEGFACFEDPNNPAANFCGAPQPDGSSCDDDAECVSRYCNWDTDICAAKAGPGEPCAGVDGCQEGLGCEGGVCIEMRYPGDTCDDTLLLCQYSRCVNGVCELRAPLGDPCGTEDDCTSTTCSNGICVDPNTCP